jgi:hypothetical protein
MPAAALLFLALALAEGCLLDALVADLGADEFRRRERAAAVLRHLGALAYPRLRKAAAASADLEVKRRAEELLRPIQRRALDRARERLVVIRGNRTAERYLGTLVSANGRKAYVLTANHLSSLAKEGVSVEWGGKAYPGTFTKYDDDLGLALLCFSCRRELPPVRLASGHTKGCWWNGHADPSASFRENMVLSGATGREAGCGVFTLDEASLTVRLAGVNSGVLLVDWVPRPFVPGVGRIRKFLEGTEALRAPKR